MYLPILPIYIYGVVRTRKLLYFTAANPGIEMGGFFGEKKDEILDLILDKYKVRDISVQSGGDISEEELNRSSIQFPVIAKPNVGERGHGVELIGNPEKLKEYKCKEQDYIIQEYVDFPIELGVLYFRLPGNQKGQVTSITQKEFLTVVGDGVSSVYQLLEKHSRGKLYRFSLKSDYSERLTHVPMKGEKYEVHRIGNHSKGTRFLDSNKYVNQKVNHVFDRINSSVKGVYYGRYDLKVPSFKDLEEGKNIKIFELNGVSSEPGHMYDQPNVLYAYRILAKHWIYIIDIAEQNIKSGAETTPLSYFLSKIKRHFLS